MKKESQSSELEALKIEFSNYRRRSKQKVDEAYQKGQENAILEMLDIIDDCDRAIEHLRSVGAPQGMTSGLKQLRERSLRRFEDSGFEAFCQEGDKFDPNLHQAISVKPGNAPDGSILQVHQLGWKRKEDEQIIRPAIVSVVKGNLKSNKLTIDDLEARTRRRRRRQVEEPENYICPFGVEDCRGNCADCVFSRKISNKKQTS